MSNRSFVVVALLWVLPLVSCGRGKVESVSNADPSKVRSANYVVVAEGDWPWWAGPNRDFESAAESIPVDFDEQQNCSWKYLIPGEGHSSPIVVGDKVFVTAADESAKTKSLVCVERKSGEEKWIKTLHQGAFMHTHGKNSQASATPASDGERIFTAFMFDNGIQVSAVNMAGDILWQQKAGGFQSRHGFGSSLIIYKSLVIAAGDNPGSGFITAFDRETGEIVWRISRVNESSYSTPNIVKLNDKDQLIISGAGKVHAYDPATGEEFWSSEGPAKTTANTLVSDGKLVFSGGGYPENRFYCIEPTTQQVKWKVNLKSYVPSPLLVNNSVIIPQDGGILASLNKETGEQDWKIRFGQDVSGSAIQVRNRIYIGGERGTVFVVDTSGKILAKNKLDGRIMSTPAISGKQLFVRTAGTLFCFVNSTIEKPNQ